MKNTQDISQFGKDELKEAAKLLTAYCESMPDWLEEGISIEFNPESGCVFLIDKEFNVGMMNGEELEQWHNCPECGTEGFLEDILEEENECCYRQLEEAGLIDENERYRRRVKEGPTSSGSCKLEDIVEGVKYLIPEGLFEEFRDADDEEKAQLYEEIVDHLYNIAPPWLEFGSHQGDGAEFGFWRIEEEAC